MPTQIRHFSTHHQWLRYLPYIVATLYFLGWWGYYCHIEGFIFPVDWLFHMKEDGQAAWALVFGTLFSLRVTEWSASDRDRRDEKHKEEAEVRRKKKEYEETLRYVIKHLVLTDTWKVFTANNSHAFRQIEWQSGDADVNAIGVVRKLTGFREEDYSELTPPDGIDPRLAEAAFKLQILARRYLWEFAKHVDQVAPFAESNITASRLRLRGGRAHLDPVRISAETLASAASRFAEQMERFESDLIEIHTR